MVKAAEGIQWLFTIGNTLSNVVEFLMNTHQKLPEEWKQKIPGFLGLSLADEQIFNGVLGQIETKKQVAITRFLKEKCKDYERNRFVNIVAGMEVEPIGKVDDKKESFDDNGRKVTETKTSSGSKKDKREDFLNKFADIILLEFNGDLQKVYDYCLGNRLLIADPMHQKALRTFSESVAAFKKIVLLPFGVASIAELAEKASRKLSDNSADLANKTQTFRERAKAFRQKQEQGGIK